MSEEEGKKDIKVEKEDNKLEHLFEEILKKLNDNHEETKKQLEVLKDELINAKESFQKEIFDLKNENEFLKEKINDINKEMTSSFTHLETKISFDDEIGSFGHNDIWDAARDGHLPAMKYYLEKDPSCINEFAPTIFHWTPLQLACENGYLYIIKYLVSKGADFNLGEPSLKTTALQLACGYGHLKIVQYLLNLDTSRINDKNIRNDTPLHHAARSGNLELCKFLIENGADPKLKNVDNETPLSSAKYYKFTPIIDYLEPLTNDDTK